MTRTRSTIFIIITLVFTICNAVPSAAQDEAPSFSLIFGWQTAGQESLLARKTTAIDSIDVLHKLTLSFGSLLGKSRIVDYDKGDRFLLAAREAGIDYLIPSAPEFMFGLDEFKTMVAESAYPRFVSANVVDESSGRTLAEPYAMWLAGGRRICVVGMSDADIVKEAADKNVAGIDVITFNEALTRISLDIARENPDMVIVAGRMDRAAVMEMALNHPFVDLFVTNNQSGGFITGNAVATSVTVAGKPVYIGSEAPNHLGAVIMSEMYGFDTYEFRDTLVDDRFKLDPSVYGGLEEILKDLRQLDYEETVVRKTGEAVTAVLKESFSVDAVMIDRQSLFYYPLEDSLTVFNVQKIVKPFEKLSAFTIKGADIKSALAKSAGQIDPAYRLLTAGISADGKINDIPIQNDTDYYVLTTTHLRMGGSGYEQFTRGEKDTIEDANMLEVVENYLVLKEKRIREAEKQKIWQLNLYLSLHADFDRKDVDLDKNAYGNDIPKSWRSYQDYYQGSFLVSSQKNRLTVDKTIGLHMLNNYLEFSYSRKGSKNHNQNKVVYDEPRNSDPVEWYSKYTYNIPNLPVKPYIDVKLNSFLYSGAGKHPLTATVSSGATRTFPRLLNLNVSVGVSGTRNYENLTNNMGVKGRITLKKDIPTGKILKTPISLDSKTDTTWSPLAEYYMAFQLENDNTVRFKIMDKISVAAHVKSYSYRNTKIRKVATAYYYFMTIDYGMEWKF